MHTSSTIEGWKPSGVNSHKRPSVDIFVLTHPPCRRDLPKGKSETVGGGVGEAEGGLWERKLHPLAANSFVNILK